MVKERTVDPPAPALQQRVVDHDQQRRAGIAEAVCDQCRDRKPELVARPARAAVTQTPDNLANHEHPADRSSAGLGDLADDQGPEGLSLNPPSSLLADRRFPSDVEPIMTS